jgi:hypothetical protein
VSAAVAVRRALAVVTDLDSQAVPLVADRHGRAGIRGVLHDVGQRLLHDPVGGEVDARCELDRLPLDAQLHVDARRPHLLDEPPCLGKAGLWGENGHTVVRAQDPEQASHLGERLPGGRLHGFELLRLARPLVTEPPANGPRLDDDHADRVGDHVVELARDQGPLLRNGAARLLLPSALERRGPVLQRGRPEVAAAERRRERERGPEDDREKQEVPGVPSLLDRDGAGQEREADREEDRSAPPRRVRAHRVEADEEHRHQVGRVGEDDPCDLRGEQHAEHEHQCSPGEAAAPGERHGGEQGEGDVLRHRLVAAGARLRDCERRERACEGQVCPSRQERASARRPPCHGTTVARRAAPGIVHDDDRRAVRSRRRGGGEDRLHGR